MKLDLVKSISNGVKLPSICLNTFILSLSLFIVKPPAIPIACNMFKLLSIKLYLPGKLTSPRIVK